MKSLLTPLMREVLKLMLANNWISYMGKQDETLKALKRLGYVTHRSGCEYSHDHWCLTETGVRVARELREEAKP